ncbi:MAG TPA: LysR substrate-binding domain-containing protein [Burkholderiaceae bacterium]|nr:LysR substrate-binding domain-containing protein [Burkholderiaceae bacterium]
MRDLNELWHYAAVVQHGGFSAAARATGIAKSSLSKSVARLEERLGLRLIERSTRRLRVTELGDEFYRHCQAMLESAELAEALAADALAEPQGRLRMTCPQGLLQELLTDMLPEFLLKYPRIELQLTQLDRLPDLIDEGTDVAIGIREIMTVNDSVVARELGTLSSVMVASPEFLKRHPVKRLEDLAALPALSMIENRDRRVLELRDPKGRLQRIEQQARLVSGNLGVLRSAAVRQVGVALLPEHICRRQFASGELVDVLPGWSTPIGTVLLVYAGRKGLRPSVRALIDWLADEMGKVLRPVR